MNSIWNILIKISSNVANKEEFKKKFKSQKKLVFLSIPFVLFIFVFNYLPVYGWLMAFQNYSPRDGIINSEWIGLDNFKMLFQDAVFWNVIRNTLVMSLMKLVSILFCSIALAIMLNEMKNLVVKRTIQTVSYLPHFISWVVGANLFITLLSIDDGIVNELLLKLGIIEEAVLWMGQKEYFWLIITISHVWKEVGWSAIIFLSAMTAISPALYESADIDGASRLQKIFFITIPGIKPTVTIILIMSCGMILNAGFEQQLLMGNPMVKEVSDVLEIFVLRYGISLGRYSFATAAGIFKSLISITMVFVANSIARKLGTERLV